MRQRLDIVDVPDLILLVDPASLQILEVNRGVDEQVLGWSVDELHARTLDQVVPGATADLIERARIGKHDPHPDTPLRVSFAKKDGRVVPVDIKVRRAADGDALVCAVRQLSETARVAERELVSVVCAVPTAVVTWRHDGTIVSWNPAAERLFHTAPKDAIGKSIDCLVPVADRDAFHAACERLWATGTPESHEVLRQSGLGLVGGAEGAELEVEESLFLIRDVAWQPVRIGAAFRDMAEVARLRRANQALAGIDERQQASLTAQLSAQLSRPRSQKSLEVLAAAGMAAADPRATILLLGETGVGKSHLARHIHVSSPRKDKPFLEVNCAGIDAQLAESELFGHERGAFTGAVGQKRGLVEAAEGGTLLLDEVAELPPPVQAKLLTFLDDGGFRRVGSVKRLSADVRIIAATNVDLQRAVDEGRFRKDLFFRLRVLPITLPPLRDRRAEIADLASDMLAELCRRRGQPPRQLSPQARTAVSRYPWPGNFRELKNALERALVVSNARGAAGERSAKESAAVIDVEHLPVEVQHPAGEAARAATSGIGGGAVRLDDVIRQHIKKVLEDVGGNRTKAAELLGIDRTTLRRRLGEDDDSGSVAAAK